MSGAKRLRTASSLAKLATMSAATAAVRGSTAGGSRAAALIASSRAVSLFLAASSLACVPFPCAGMFVFELGRGGRLGRRSRSLGG